MENNASGRVPEFAHPSIIVDFNNASHIRLLERAWTELFEEEFPDPKQQETVADWMRRAQDPNVEVIIPIIGDNLHDPENAVIKGFAVGTLFKDVPSGNNTDSPALESEEEFEEGATFLQDYTLARKKYRGQGIGKQLMLEREFNAEVMNNNQPLIARCAEIQDWRKCDGEDRKKAERRSKGFTGNGQAEIVNLRYTQPSLSGLDKEDGLILISYRLKNGQYASPKAIEKMLVAMYKHYGIFPPKDVDLVRMRGELREQAANQSIIPLQPLAA